MKLATPRPALTTINGAVHKTPGVSASIKKPTMNNQINRTLFGYRTPNPTSTTDKPANAKLALTMGAKSATTATTTAAANQKSRLPVSTFNQRSNFTKPTTSTAAKSSTATTPSLVKQRLEFFSKPQISSRANGPAPATSKTPMNSRLAEDKKAASAVNTPFGRLFTPKSQPMYPTGSSAVKSSSSSVAQPPNRFVKSTTVVRNQPGLLSKTPAAKRPLPSSCDKKVSRTVDCAKSIKRRSIKFLNAVINVIFFKV